METSRAKLFLLCAFLIALTVVDGQGGKSAAITSTSCEVLNKDIIKSCEIKSENCELNVNLELLQPLQGPIELNMNTEDENHQVVHSDNKEMEQPFEELEKQNICVDHTLQEPDASLGQGENIMKGCNLEPIMLNLPGGLYHSKVTVTHSGDEMCIVEFGTEIKEG